MEDIVFVRKVAVQAEIGLDCWQRPKPQPALLSLKVYNSVERAGQTDHIDDTLDYRGIYKFLSAFHGCKVNRAGDVLEQMWIWGSEKGKRVDSVVELPKALLHSEGVRMETTPLAGASDSQITFHIQNLIVPCIIGIGAHERIHKQPVVVNIELEWNDRTELINSEIKEKDEMLRNIPGHFGGIYEVNIEDIVIILSMWLTLGLSAFRGIKFPNSRGLYFCTRQILHRRTHIF